MKSPARRISIAFFGIMLFVTSQLLWWNIFFARYSNKASQIQVKQWKIDQAMLRDLFRQIDPKQQKVLVARCDKVYPFLNCHTPSFHIRPRAYHKLLHEKQRYQRMFLLEGSFFFLIFLGGLFVLWLGIRAERELKHRQQNFLSAVSHEMRTPISTMRLTLETLQMRTLSKEKQERYMSRLNKQVDRLQHTCEQVVAAAMLDISRPERSLPTGELNEQVSQIVDNVRPDLEDRNVRLTWTPAPESLYVQVEQSALSLILNNLIENAVKYNPKEDKQVHIRLQQRETWALLQVEDNGVGIPPEEQEKVFTPFYRVGEEMTRQKDGLGLGLYLVKGLTESMHGRVHYEQLPSGSLFTLEWLILENS